MGSLPAPTTDSRTVAAGLPEGAGAGVGDGDAVTVGTVGDGTGVGVGERVGDGTTLVTLEGG
ncbi:MAG TPA: hypothetical protein VID25_01565 [Candidatus Limnocylindrales bacterium]